MHSLQHPIPDARTALPVEPLAEVMSEVLRCNSVDDLVLVHQNFRRTDPSPGPHPELGADGAFGAIFSAGETVPVSWSWAERTVKTQNTINWLWSSLAGRPCVASDAADVVMVSGGNTLFALGRWERAGVLAPRDPGVRRRELLGRRARAALPAQGAGAAGARALGRGARLPRAVRARTGGAGPQRPREAARGAVPREEVAAQGPVRPARRQGAGVEGEREGDPGGVQEVGAGVPPRPLRRRRRPPRRRLPRRLPRPRRPRPPTATPAGWPWRSGSPSSGGRSWRSISHSTGRRTTRASSMSSQICPKARGERWPVWM